VADVEDLRIILRAEVDKAVADLKKGAKAAKGADKDFGDLAKQFKRQVTEAASMQRAFTQMAGSVAAGLGAFSLLRGAIQGANQLARESVQAFQVQEQAIAKLEGVLKATGGAAGLTSKQMQEFASELQSSTTYGDEAIIDMQGTLATFKSVSGDTFKDATRLALDLSAAFGSDLQVSAMQVGKALEDPVKGVSALQKVGVSFTENQKNLIKQLVETGDKAGAQQIILKELEGQVGGVAGAMADTSSGAMMQYKNMLSDTKEEIGRFILDSAEPMVRVLGNLAVAWRDALAAQNNYHDALKAKMGGNASQEQELVLLEERLKQLARMQQTPTLALPADLYKKQTEALTNQINAIRETIRLQNEATASAGASASAVQRAADQAAEAERKKQSDLQQYLDRVAAMYGKTSEGKLDMLRKEIAEFEKYALTANKTAPEVAAVLAMLRSQLAELEKPIITGNKDVEAVRERLAQLYSQTKEGMAAAKAETIAFAQAQLVLAQASGASEDELAKLDAILRNLTQADSIDVTTTATEGLSEALAEMSKTVAGGAFLDFFEALGSGADGADSFSQAFGRMVQDMARQTSQLALTAGLKMLATPGGEAIGIALLAMAGVSAAFGGAIGKAMAGPRTVDYGKYIVDPVIAEEKRLAEERIRLLREQLATEKKIRDDNLRALDSYFNQEFTVLRDQWERNLISTSDYESQATAMRARQGVERGEAEAPYDEAQAELDAEEEAERIKKKNLEDARQAKLDILARDAAAVQHTLNNMSGFEKFMTSKDDHLEGMLGLIDAKIKYVSAATTIEQIQRAATGADFVTSGPQLLMVGDNPGGRERVKVEPIGSPNLHGPRGEGLTIQINGPVYGIDHLYETLEAAGRKLHHQRRVKGSVFA